MNHRLVLAALAILFCPAPGRSADAVSPPPATVESSPLDRELFQPGPAPQQSPKKDTPRNPDTSKARPDDDQPLQSVARQMREVQVRIGRMDSGPQTQAVQQQIVAELDRLIAQARNGSQKPSAAQSQAKPSPSDGTAKQPSKPSSDRSGPRPGVANGSGTAKPDRLSAAQRRHLLAELWGELPEKERDVLLQSSAEEFLPKYEALIEDYFRRLAEEKGKGP